MKKKLQTAFDTRQHMISRDFEIFYYSDGNLSEIRTHAHDYYEFYFFLEGDVSIQIGAKLQPVKYGDILLVPPHTSHRPIIHSLSKPYRRFVFWVSQDYYRHLQELSGCYTYLNELLSPGDYLLFHNDRVTFNSIQSKVLRLIEEQQVKRFGQDAEIPLCVNDLILYLNRLYWEQTHPKEQSESVSLYESISIYIEEHLEEPLSLDRLAQEFYVSKYYISHLFKDHLGLSIHQYITKKRLASCREAILGQTSITQAYQEAGFGDYSSFYRSFKKEYGISPRELQRQRPENSSDGR